MTRDTFVTVGAGQTAAVAARNLRRLGFDGRIVLVGDEPHPPYQRPPLSKEFLSGADTEDSLWILPPAWVRDNDVEIVTDTTVVRVDSSTRRVEFADGAALQADGVLIATGGSPRRLPVEGPRPDLVHYLRTLDDARRLAPVLSAGRRLAIIGAGFIGLEIAATAASAGVEVTVLEAVPVPLARVVGAQMGEAVCGLHRDHGVDIRAGVALTGIVTTGDDVLIQLAGAPTPLEADAVLIGVGITPNTAVAEASGLTVDDGVVVDAFGRSAVPGVFAAGDVARRYSPRAGRHVRLEHFDNASRQGVAVAHTMLGREAPNDDPMWFWSDQYDRNIQFVGTATGTPVLRGDTGDSTFAAFYLQDGAVCGAFAIDRGEDVTAARELLGRQVPVPALSDEDTDLWDLIYTDDAEVGA
ncbi:NAD(P)/FAD-dependent oxidoreductase [Mycolicibacterium vaccae]|uniref:FAD-dependent pyridine nucleotide-disulfide oxidoreductase n=1 Tax=Mycolicibacterium vaccae ATCC 25954 TaxID=1194972 RepID=K0V0J1_MYCVA|nr:FAD-dependent oxidoreductase [Mycolicibacterium vaccae]ANI38359.1 pyridine nucleotide-disulfide oxidoreductase [Mycolicibacterium vaccae 95051]EJZ10855.1 FAD-dependent pyridine nucleotide-disulfide oxidoreductase [Mycolicibacterium vaccae ATCC 25954]MCV7064343.1 FAD-dependent oxidoreductase [Mycolicibacterium vaccae]